ncbi:hypothetical protein HY642_01395 [Candidatus Woesearchaeota archaeon]|nr:hypothetical protein [Candidatus Woesearchaeota archaeon]
MQIQTHYTVETPEVRGPHRSYGKFICSPADERENNLVARFTEEIWMRAGGEKYVVSFTPSASDLSFWVNGTTEKVVRGVIDEAVAKLQSEFKRSGLQSYIKGVHKPRSR